MKKLDPVEALAAMKAKFDEADLGVAFRSAHGMSQEDWIAQQIAGGATPGSATNTARKMANAALVGRRLREQQHQMSLGRAYSTAGERNKIDRGE
ncbi:hypothetical protein [Sphingomonas adhaesiva]|uniref:hypothetical protein n=1 Tax=Sphingomonas adhaesiva TaxID=28212 RepID=UPI002FFCD8EA